MPLENLVTYKVIFDSASMAMALTDDAGVILDVNQAWIKSTGISGEQALGKTAHGLGLWDDQAQRDVCRAELVKNGMVSNFEAVLVMQSHRRSYLLHATPQLWNTLLAGQTWDGNFVNRRKDGGIYYEQANIKSRIVE